MTEQPLGGVLFGVAALAWAVRVARSVAHGMHRRDPVRTFPPQDKANLLARAGHRCEHHGLLSGRCRTTEGLQADHVHPHSRGGWTALDNGQVLCARHNRAKGARVPWNWQLNRLARHRAGYFPPGTPTHVVRHRSRRSGTPGSPPPAATGQAAEAARSSRPRPTGMSDDDGRRPSWRPDEP